MAVAIVAILSAGLYMVGSRVETQAKIKQTQSTIEILSAALEQYYDANSNCFPFTAVNNFKRTDLQSQLQSILGSTLTVSVSTGVPADYNDHYASDDTLYYYLNRIPASKKIIGTINSSLITDKDCRKREYFYYFTAVPTTHYPLLHFVDAWNSPFRYTYSSGDNFPVIESAGPDKDFGDTIPAKKDDNITSR